MSRVGTTLRAAAVMAGALVGCVTACAQTLHLPPHEKVVLKNGLTVLLLEKRGVPLIDVTALVKAGSAADPLAQAGLASVSAGLLRKGTATRSARQFAADLDFIGASFEPEVKADFTTIRAEFLAKDSAKAFELFSDALLHASFPQDEVTKLLAQDLDAVKGAKDDPRSVMSNYYSGYLFGTHPYGRPTDGDEVSLKHIDRDAVLGFYGAHYTPGNMILAVAGDFDSVQMRQQIEQAFGGWTSKPTSPVAIPQTDPVKGKRLLLIDKPDATQTYFAMGNLGIARNDPDRVAVHVVDTIFGGRFTSELNEALRVESGYTYGAFAFFNQLKTPGPFEIYSFTKNETTIQAIDLALQVLEKLHQDGVTAEQLKSAKSYIKGQFPPEIETSAQLAPLIATNEFYGLGDDEVNQLESRVDAVTPEVARRVIAKHFPAENLVFVLIGKASEIGPAVRKYAEKEDERAIADPGFWPPPAGK